MTEKPWTPPPEPLVVDLSTPISVDGQTWNSITLRAPTTAEVMTATAVRGASEMDVATRLIQQVSGIPLEGVKQLPAWMTAKIGQYFNAFMEGPPLYPTKA